MLSQYDFINMLADMRNHVARAVRITDELAGEVDDKDLRFKLIALRQSKQLHLEAMTALTALLKKNLAGSEPVVAAAPARGEKK